MIKRTKEIFRTIGIDIIGVLLIILSALTGWLPGPGGIPLFLAGLSLLAVNHEWARRWKHLITQKGFSFFKRLFPKSPRVQLAHDVLTVVLFSTAFVVATNYDGNFWRGLTVSLSATGLAIFFINRDRLERMTRLFKHYIGR